MDEVVEKATGGRHLDVFQRRIIIANPIDCLGDEGVKGLIVSHEFAGLSFTRLDGRANDHFRVKHGMGLEGSNRQGEFRDGKGLARQEGFVQDVLRDWEERAGLGRGEERSIEGECRSAHVRKGGRGACTRRITRRGNAIDHRSWKSRRG